MKSSVETLSPTRVKLTVEVPFEEMSDSLAAAYTRISSQVTIPGFRKGKVPPRVIDQRVGRESVLEEAVNEALPAAYDAAITENEVVAVGQPQVEVTELEDNEKLVFTAEVDIRPEFELPEYAGLAVSVADTEVNDEKVTEQLDELRKRFATALPVERAAQDDDLVLIDVDGTLDGEKQEEYSATALSYEVGSAGMVNGADEAIRGLSEGETATFPFTPEEGEVAGQELSITVTVQGVRERSLPDADDEFAQLASEFDTLEELRGDLRERVERMALVEQGMEAREKALKQLLETVEIPVPQSLLDAQVAEHFEDGHGDDEHRAEVEENTSKSIRTQFLLDKIADTEELSVGQAELTQWLIAQAPRYGMSPDQFADALVQAGQVPMAVADVRRGKALATVLQKAAVTDASGNEVNLAALDQAEADEMEEELEEALEELAEEEIAEEIVEELAEEIAEEIVEEVIAEEIAEEIAEAVAEAETKD
ncbi:MAG: trigger factor [Candidatus Nanopelagicales bacterium]